MVETVAGTPEVGADDMEAAALARRGILYQIAAEASSDTKLLIPADPSAIDGPWGDRVFLGLDKLAALGEDEDYSGVTAAEARAEIARILN